MRSNGIINENEIAIIEGDLLVAKNVINEKRRIIGNVSDTLLENNKNKRILKG